MASVSSLDQDMKKLRMSRYTASAAAEVRTWIEATLHESLPTSDVLEALKDGTILCRLANLAVPNPGVKFKKSPMPFIQMENISHFLRACEVPPLSLPSHDRFLTVDLYEGKDPAQVLQCLGAFSRVANKLNPHNFPTTIGPKKGGSGVVSPQGTGYDANLGSSSFGSTNGASRGRGLSNAAPASSSTFNPISRDRAISPALTGGSSSSKATDGGPKSPQGPVSSWSKRTDEGVTSPAWNIHQYGYMGGASQGNQGISFGARRQITSAGPHVPSLAEKERKRKEREAEEERLKVLAEEAENKRRIEREAEEERARLEEERRWEEETARQREEEQRRLEAQKREWEEQERQWRQEEEQRLHEEAEAEARHDRPSATRQRTTSDARLRGQMLSEYQAEQKKSSTRARSRSRPRQASAEEEVARLRRELEEAKERERRYQMEREERHGPGESSHDRSRSRSRTRQPARPPSPKDSEVSWAGDEREYLRQQWHANQASAPRPLPDPAAAQSKSHGSSRPLPDPSTYKPQPPAKPFQQAPPQPPRQQQAPPQPTRQQRPDNQEPTSSPPPLKWNTPRPLQAQKSGPRSSPFITPAASNPPRQRGAVSLLEREMERERERQREWEAAQEETSQRVPDQEQGSGAGKTWDVNQYGYLGGDNQNRGGQGIGMGGRRQIIGPRPLGPR
jgi:transgelin